MAPLILLALISTISATPNLQPSPYIGKIFTGDKSDYRLSPTTIPSKYNISLEVPKEALESDDATYTGYVEILFRVTEPKNTVLINSLVNINQISATVADTDEVIDVSISNISNNTQIVTLVFAKDLIINTDYNLLIHFISKLDTTNVNLGFYRTDYNENGQTQYLASTQFEPVYARTAFPCFDEPQYKAIFNLRLTYPKGYRADANTLGTVYEDQPSSVTTVFKATPIMSSYLVAFTISKFDCTDPTLPTAFPQRVCSRPNAANERSFAADNGVKILNALDAWTQQPYKDVGPGKMDQFGIPNFAEGAMENWGFSTYLEPNLFYSTIDTSNYYKQGILSVIAHEFSHMWFGDLVTTKWWDTIFLNEGFATYFESFLLTQIPEFVDFEMDKQFVIKAQQVAIASDAYLSAPSLTSEAFTPQEVWDKFNRISYQKGGTLLRMIENVIGPTRFQQGLRKFLADNKYGSSTPSKLWNAISETLENGRLADGITFLDFVENWTNKPGFPVITATLQGNNIILKQERFLFKGTEENPTRWYVPITYITANNEPESFVWFQPENDTIILENIASDNSWVILNNNAAGYYIVEYDNVLRERIITALNDDHEKISDLNRAQILSDITHLVQAQRLKPSEAVKVLNYLKKEKSYYPWYAGLSLSSYASQRFEKTSGVGAKINDLLLDLLKDITEDLYDTNWDTVTHIDSIKLPMLWDAACQAGQDTCINKTLDLFSDFRDKNISIHKTIRSDVYCNALIYSPDIQRDYDYLMNRYKTYNQVHEKLNILRAIGCATPESLLVKYLEESINPNSPFRTQDFAKIWASVYSSSLVGVDVAFKYFRDHYEKILLYYPGAASVLPAITSRFTTNAQFEQLDAFITGLPVDHVLRGVSESVSVSAKENLQHQAFIKEDLEHYFGLHPSAVRL